jgi:hypothetical protein
MTESPDVCGRARALTVISPVRTPWPLVLKLVFALVQAVPGLTRVVRELSFIHYAHWSLVGRIPENGPPQRPEELRYTHLLFVTNYNGTWNQYIDAFARILTLGMRVFWGSSYGFPGPTPTEPFKSYIRHNELASGHYYCAYPRAGVTMISSALSVQGRFQALREIAADPTTTPEAFAGAYRRFLTDAQHDL